MSGIASSAERACCALYMVTVHHAVTCLSNESRPHGGYVGYVGYDGFDGHDGDVR